MQYIDLGVEELVILVPDEYDVEQADDGGFLLYKEEEEDEPYISVYEVVKIEKEGFDFEQVLEEFTKEADNSECLLQELEDKFYYKLVYNLEDLNVHEYAVLYNNVRFDMHLFIDDKYVDTEVEKRYVAELEQMIASVGIVIEEQYKCLPLSIEELTFVEANICALLGVTSEEVKSQFDSGRALDVLQWLFDEQCFDLKDTVYMTKLGLLFGALLRYYYFDFNWVVVEGSIEREFALQYQDTNALLFPISLVSSRLETGEPIRIPRLLNSLFESVEDK